MSLVKLIFKIVFKWLFSIMASAENAINEPPRHRDANGYGQAPSNGAESNLNRSVSYFKQAVQDFEDNLNRTADSLLEKNGKTSASGTYVDGSDINELRAELAELKAEIRGLRRIIPENVNADDSSGEN